MGQEKFFSYKEEFSMVNSDKTKCMKEPCLSCKKMILTMPILSSMIIYKTKTLH